VSRNRGLSGPTSVYDDLRVSCTSRSRREHSTLIFVPSAKGYPVDVSSADPNWAEALTGVATLLLVFGAVAALLQIGLTRRAGHAEALTGAAIRWNEPEFQAARAQFRKHIDAGGPEKLRDEMARLRSADPLSYYQLLTILDYFEDVAILLKHRAVRFRMVNDSLGGTVCWYWNNCHLFVHEVLRPNNPTQYQHFERLGRKIEEKGKSLGKRTATKLTRLSLLVTTPKAEKHQLILLFAAKRANVITLETYPELTPSDLVVVSHSVSEPAVIKDTSAMVVLRVSDGSTVSVHMWDSGFRRYTISRVLAA
jgi:hypothetical protein